MAQYDDLPIQRITAVSLISIAVTVVTILAVQVVYFGMLDYVNSAKSASGRYSESDQILAGQKRSISRVGVNDEDAKLVIPIESAMKRMVSQAAENHERNTAENDDT